MLLMKHVIEKEDKHMFTIEWSYYRKGFYPALTGSKILISRFGESKEVAHKSQIGESFPSVGKGTH